MLAYLELNGTIVATAPYYSEFRVQFLRDEARVLAGYDAQRKNFLLRLFAAGQQGRSWLTIDVAAVAAEIGETEERIRKAIGYLEEMGDVIVKPARLRHGFRIVQAPESIPELASHLVRMFEKREERDVARLAQVVSFAEAPGCFTDFLLSYFGEKPTGGCGHCARCEGKEAKPLPRQPDL